MVISLYIPKLFSENEILFLNGKRNEGRKLFLQFSLITHFAAAQ